MIPWNLKILSRLWHGLKRSISSVEVRILNGCSTIIGADVVVVLALYYYLSLRLK